MSKSELKNIDMTAKFTNFQVINKYFTLCRCNDFYTGRNRNYSDITDDALQKFIARKGYANVPVVAHLMKDDDGKYYIGGHDSKIVIDNNGIELVNECVPFGVIPEDCNPSMDLITERSGEQRKYFSVDIILWTHRYPIMEAAYSDEIYFNQSMEIFFEDYSWDQDYVVVNDFSMSALCLLRRSMDSNENIEPCFESSRVKAFSIDTDKFKQNFELMLEKIKQYESAGTTTTVQNNATNNNPQMEGENKMDLTKFTTLLSEIKCEGNDCIKYELLLADKNKIYVFDKEDGYKIYSVEYVTSNDGDPVINWNTKTEGDITFAEKSEEVSHLTAIYNEINDSLSKKYADEYQVKLDEKIKEVSGEIETKYTKLQEDHETLKNSYSVVKEKLDKFEAIEAEKAKQSHIEAVKETLERFEKKIGKAPEFIYFKAKLDENYENIDLEKLDKDLTMLSGDVLMNSNSKKTFSYNPTSTNVNKYNTENDLTNRYGHLFDGFVD